MTHAAPRTAASRTAESRTGPASARPSILITGGASGIGRAAAERFAAAGWTVGIVDVNGAAAQAAAAALPHGGVPGTHMGQTLDVTDAEQWPQRVAAFVAHAGGRLDVLLNNAGIAVTDPFGDTPLPRLHRLVDVNLKGVMNGCHAALPYLRATPDSRVINLCSASALYGQPMLAVYSATKAGVRSLTEALDIEWGRHGVRVVDVLPLFVDTDMVRGEVHKMKTVQRLGVRLGPDDVAAAIYRLACGRPARLPVHTMVGWQTRLFALGCRLSPDRLNKQVTAAMAGF